MNVNVNKMANIIKNISNDIIICGHKNGVDVSKLASLLTGGGHSNAAGFSNRKSLSDIIKITKCFLEDYNNGK